MNVPPTLSYTYVSATPVILEGSIVKNLLLGAAEALHRRMPTEQHVGLLLVPDTTDATNSNTICTADSS